MKKIFILTALMIATISIFSGCYENTITINDEQDLVRIHIRADSNDKDDQEVKLKVRDAIVGFLEPRLNNVRDFDEAYGIILRLCPTFASIADEVLRQNGFGYSASVSLTREYFPTRMYGNAVVESGVYDALIINLGSGKGDNWWCVVYPPLCYLDSSGKVVYKSKIKELFDRYS